MTYIDRLHEVLSRVRLRDTPKYRALANRLDCHLERTLYNDMVAEQYAADEAADRAYDDWRETHDWPSRRR